MTHYRDILVSLLRRVLVAAPVFAVGACILLKAQGGFAATGPMLIGMAFIVAGALILAIPLARLIAEPWGSLFYPSEALSKLPPMYGIPETLRRKGHYDEAMAGYREITRNHAEELKPYVEMIDMAIMDLKDAALARSIYGEGVKAFRGKKEEAVLTTMYNAIRSRLEDHALAAARPVRHRKTAPRRGPPEGPGAGFLPRTPGGGGGGRGPQSQ